jgi:hypothetical protein
MDPGGGLYTFKKQSPTPTFNQGVSLPYATLAQLEFVDRELARYVQAGAWEPSTCSDCVSRLFLAPKPGNNQWMLICDLRPHTKYCAQKRLNMETLPGVKHMTRNGDYMFSFDMHDGFYALGINPAARDYVTVNERGQLNRLAGLLMGWSLTPFCFLTPLLQDDTYFR